jgi:outer membrane protein OmpA-like peptidoglycan-associated protein
MWRLSIFALLAAGVTQAHAQAIELEPFRPAIDSRGFVTVNGAGVLGHAQLSLGLVTTWGNRALRLEGYRVDDVITPTLQAAFGLFGRAELGVSLPFRIVSGDESSQGLGNVGLHGKLRFFGGVGALVSVYFAGSGAFMGDDQTTVVPSLVLEHRFGRLRLGANLGWRRRETRRFMTLTAASELPAGFAASFAVARDRVDLVSEIYGAIPLEGQDHHPLEATLGVKVYLAKSSHFVAGAGSSLLSPSVRAYVGIVFEPRLGSRARGEIAEVAPPVPAPEPTPEPDEPLADLDEDCLTDDCPDRKTAIRTHSEIVIHDVISFRTGSAEILPDSYPILDAVAETLLANPDIELLEVAGHADERGSDDYNLRLTQDRAEAVRGYLISRQAQAERLVARGYGESTPVDRRHNEAAWKQNRRVQFLILRQGSPGP